MTDVLDEDVRLGNGVGHVCGVVLVHVDRGEGVPGDLQLRRQNRCMGEANKSRRRKSPAQLRQMSKGRHPGRAPASAAMADRHEEKAPHYLTVEWKLAGTTPIAG